MFDFTDPLSDLRGKEIKRLSLTELVDYISNNRGVITESVYPEVIKMVFVDLTQSFHPTCSERFLLK